MHRRGRRLLGIALAGTLAACSGGSRPSTHRSTTSRLTTSSSASSTSTTAAPTTTLLPTTTTLAPGADAQIDAAIATMDARTQAAQLVVSGFDGTTAPTLPAGLGGVIAFGENLRSATQVRAVNQAISCTGSIEPWISVDQEPGRIARLQGILPDQPAPATLGAQYAAHTLGRAQVVALGRAQGRGLAGLGFDLDFAPVVDVNRGTSMVGDRSFGRDPMVVSTLADAYLEGLRAGGVAAVAKHFPGLGSVSADPHVSDPHLTISLAEWRHTDRVPFAYALAHGVDAVMVTNVIFDAVDAQHVARSSPAVVALLRNDLHDGGLVVTDAIEMGSGTQGTPDAAAVAAIRAGVDLVLVRHANVATQAVATVESAIRSGTIPHARVVDALRHTLRAKVARHGLEALDPRRCAR